MSFPIKPIYLFADSQLLFWSQDGEPFLGRVRAQIDSDQPKAAYIGASNGDDPVFFSIFEGAMEQIGVEDCRMIYADYQEEDEAYLKQADLVLLAGGDVHQGWQAIDGSGMGQEIIQRYYGGAVLMGVSAGAAQLGLKGWTGDDPERDSLFDTFKLIPFVVDAHDEANQWRRLKAMVNASDEAVKGMGIPSGGGLIYHPDHHIEPVRQSLSEFEKKEDEVVHSLLFPPSGDEEPAVAEDGVEPESA